MYLGIILVSTLVVVGSLPRSTTSPDLGGSLSFSAQAQLIVESIYSSIRELFITTR